MDLVNIDQLNIEYLLSDLLLDKSSIPTSNIHQLKLASEVKSRLNKFTSIPKVFFSTFIKADLRIFHIIDALFGTVTDLEQTCKNLPQFEFIKRDLLKLVNNPIYRNLSESAVDITNVKHAAVFFGCEAMRVVLPYMLLRDTFKVEHDNNQDPYGLEKSKYKFLRQALKVSVLSTEMSDYKGCKNYQEAFLLTTISHMAIFSVVTAYIQIFEAQRTAYIALARKKFNSSLLDQALDAKPSLTEISVLTSELWRTVAIGLCDIAEFESLDKIKNTFHVQNKENNRLSFIGKWVMCSYHYSIILNLFINGKISQEQKLFMLKSADIDKVSFDLAKRFGKTVKKLFRKEQEQIKIFSKLYYD